MDRFPVRKILALAVASVVTLILLLSVLGGIKRRIQGFFLGISPPLYSKIVSEKDLMVKMRDGVELATDVYKPVTRKPCPAILIRTPYGKDGLPEGGREGEICKLFNERGYAIVVQDCRGRYKSQGVWHPWINESRDGEDAVKWLQEQPWFNGKLGTYGGSYLGCTQWALAPYARGVLTCMTPIIVSSNVYDCSYRGGLIGIGAALGWASTVGDQKGGDYGEADQGAGVWHLPVIEADDRAVTDVPFYNDWIEHQDRDNYWDLINKRPKINRIEAPALLITGWYDIFIGQQLTDYVKLHTGAGSPEGRKPRLIVGPWGHGVWGNETTDLMLKKEIIRWNDTWIRGIGEIPENPVKIFVMGANVWRDEEAWPLARAQYVPFYCHSKGKANTVNGDGWLDLSVCGSEEAKDIFIYDPFNPVPSAGGCFFGGGTADQKDVEAREDVLVFTTSPLRQDLEVTGPIRFILHAASSSPDTDFTAKLTDVDRDGRSINLQEGIIRARYRTRGKDEFLDTGKPEKFEIDLWATSNVFKKGHRIRVQISSSNFPQFDRNHNTGGNFAYETQMRKARQVIYHDSSRPSHILLPVIPSKGQSLSAAFKR